MSNLLKKLDFRRKSRLALLKAKRRLGQLDKQNDLKRDQYNKLEKYYNKLLFSKGRCGQISILPKEVVYISYEGEKEIDLIQRRIQRSIMIHGELDMMFSNLIRKFKKRLGINRR